MKYSTKLSVILIFCTAFLCSCKNESPKRSDSNATTEVEPPKVEPPKAEPFVQSMDISDAISIETKSTDGIPESTLTFRVGDDLYILTEPYDCNVISPNDYASYDIPRSAGSACQCWWAGAGADIIVREGKPGIQILKRLTDESQEAKSSAWLVLKTF